eukprot:SAG31_NODE_3721_length_3950_cov_2.867048_3_plen_421_part_00
MPLRSSSPLPRMSLAASTAQGAIVVETASSKRSATVHWLECRAGPQCSVVATAPLPLNSSTAPICLAVDQLHGTAFVGTTVGLFVGDRATMQLVRQPVPERGTAVTSLSFSPGVLAIGTAPAVFRCQLDSAGKSLGKCDNQLVSAVIDDVPTALALTPGRNFLYIGNNLSASAWDIDSGQVHRVSGTQGLPTANFTSMLPVADALWSAHAQGLSLCKLSIATKMQPPRPGPCRYFHGDRYLPGERVSAVALPAGSSLSSAPSVWAATQWGLALIESSEQTLATKALSMEARLAPLERYGWHGPTASLRAYGDKANPSPDASDNDGLWTGMLLMAQCFQYASTRNPNVRSAAWKSVRAMEFLHDVTGTPGFAARAAVKCGDKRPAGDSGPCHAPGADPKTCGWVNSTVRQISETALCWDGS